MTEIDLTVDAVMAVRLANLGLTVIDDYPPDRVPLPYLSRQPTAFIMSDMGAAGVTFDTPTTYVPRGVNPINAIQLRAQASKLVGLLYAENLPKVLDMPTYVDVLEHFGAKVEKWGYPLAFTGAAWALHCRIVLPPFDRPRQYRDVAKAYARVHAVGVTGQPFYDVMTGMCGAKVLERAAARTVFEAEHPGLHGALVEALFA